jgi:hypothetical protein
MANWIVGHYLQILWLVRNILNQPATWQIMAYG